jgi:hypothetical protein
MTQSCKSLPNLTIVVTSKHHLVTARQPPVNGSALKLAVLLPIKRGTPFRHRYFEKDLTMTRLKPLTARSLAMFVIVVLGAVSLSGCQTLQEKPPPRAVAETLSPAEPASMITPLVEKRETLTATGYAVISVQNHRNPAQQRLLAIRASKLDAYRSLTEQVYGQQLDASTTVADMVVQNDTFRTRVEGVIYGAVLVSITPAGDDTYETTMSLDKAVVRDLRMLYLGQIVAKNR